MSADNGVYILKTNTRFIRRTLDSGGELFENQFADLPVWRVAHLQGIDNLYWFEEHQPYNVGAFIYDQWGNCDPIYDESMAFKTARDEAERVEHLEYGISLIDRSHMTLYRD